MKKQLSNIEGIKEEAVKKINKFIKEWTNEFYAHLIDTDDNDGQFLRDDILELIDTAKQRAREEIKKQIGKTVDQLNWHEYGYKDMNIAKQQTIDMFKSILLANLDKLHSQTKETVIS